MFCSYYSLLIRQQDKQIKMNITPLPTLVCVVLFRVLLAKTIKTERPWDRHAPRPAAVQRCCVTFCPGDAKKNLVDARALPPRIL